MAAEQTPGSIGWVDLTVENAEQIRDFYKTVAGWQATGVPMGDYEDFCMTPPTESNPVAGICHARGSNADMPAQWMIYIVVPDIEASVKACEAGGGRVVQPIRSVGANRMAVIADPAGAVSALYEAPEG